MDNVIEGSPVATSREAYTSLVILRVWDHFTRREGFMETGWGNSKTYLCLQVKCLIFSSRKFWAFSTIFLKVYDIKFHGNPSSGSRADTDGQTDNEVNKRLLPLGEGY